MDSLCQTLYRHLKIAPKIALLPVLFGLTLMTLSGRSFAQAPQEEGVCARVKIELSQSVAITRTAFRATLTIGNSKINVPLKNVKVTLDVRDLSGTPSNLKFGISNPVLTGISDVAGTGTIDPGVQVSGVWTLLPTRDAAPNADTKYTVGGTIEYTQDGTHVSLPLFPAPITVMPDPLLQFHYFWQRDVYSDDPFTPEVEPSEPFSLGLLVVNKGKGTAHDLTITSSQPKIVDNEKGLQIAFQLLGAAVNNRAVMPSLTVDLGNVAGGDTSVARFLLLSSLQGKFIDYSAKFSHTDDLNNPRTSIIDSVDIHELEHVVRIVTPADDAKPDFLTHDNTAGDTPGSDHLPDTVWSSNGTISPVTPLLNGMVDGTPSASNPTVHLAVPGVPAGFVFIRLDNPGGNGAQLARVTRSDGREIVLGDNAWTTHRIVRLKGQAPYAQDRLYLFDDSSTGMYTLSYQPATIIPPTVELTDIRPGDTFSPNTPVMLKAATGSLQTTVNKVDFYIDNTLVGSSTTAPFTLPYVPPVGNHTLKVVATDANGTTSTSAPIPIVVNTVPNKAPTVRMTGPTVDYTLAAPAAVTVSAAAADADGSVVKVDFYKNGQFLASSISAPFVATLSSLPAGSYDFTAVATDNQNATTTSDTVTLTVEPAFTSLGAALIRVVSTVRQTAPGQLQVTLQNVGGSDAVDLALTAAKIKWGGKSPTSISPATVPMLAPNSTATFMLQFPASSTSSMLTISGTQSGRYFGGLTKITP